MPLNPERLWPIVLGQQQQKLDTMPTGLWVVFGIVMVAFIGILCHMFWEHVVKKRPVPDWKPSNDHYGEGTGGP